MKAKKISNSKYKNSGVLFELLVRQLTADTMSGKDTSPANELLHKYFNPSTEMGKELQLYRAFFDGSRLTETKAVHFIDLVLEQRRKLDDKKLAKEKYELVKEVKEVYPLKEFLSAKIPNYTLYASIYKTFATETAKDNAVNVVNIRDVANARFTLIEHLSAPVKKQAQAREDELLQEYKSQTEDLRLLTYKLLIDRFNQKYSNLNDKQQSLLREFINNVSTTNSLVDYVKKELPVLKEELAQKSHRVTDPVTRIKLNEVATQLDKMRTRKTIRDNDVTALMIVYEILKEISE